MIKCSSSTLKTLEPEKKQKRFMLKKIVSYLVIISMLWIDVGSTLKNIGGSSSEEEYAPSSPSLSLKKSSESSKENSSPPDFSSSIPLSSSSRPPQDLSFHRFLPDESDDDQKPLLSEENIGTSSSEGKSNLKDKEITPSQPVNLRGSFVQLFSDEEPTSRDQSLKTFNEFPPRKEMDVESALRLLLPIENRPFFLKWVQLVHTIDKFLYALSLREKDVTGTHWKEWCNSPPLWVEGQGVPLNTGSSFARAMTGFHQGVEYFTKQSLSYILWGLIGYQIYELKGFYPLKALRILVEGNEKSVRGILSVFVTNPVYSHYFFTLFAVPFLYGMGSSLFFARKGIKDTVEDFLNTMKAVTDFSYRKNRDGLMGFWNDKLRWFFPYPEMGGAITYLVYRLLLDGTLTKEEREAALHVVIDFAQKTTGWAKIVGLDALQKLAIGTSLNQLKMIKETYGEEYYTTLVRQRAQALEALRQENPGIRKAKLTDLLHNLYAHYLRWEMGDFDTNPTTSIAWGVYKATTLGLTINFFVQVALQIIDYLKCPKPLERGLNYAMNPSGYSLYDQKCFEAYLSVFNKVRDQPACTLTSIFPKFKLHPSYTLFNLSGAGASGEQVAELIMGLRKYQPKIHLTQFDLSNNAINTESGMRALFNAFKNITATAPHDKGIKYLDLSDNNIGFSEDTSTQILGQGLSYLPHLQTLDLSHNRIGLRGDNGTVAIGEALKYLPQLQTLDLSHNWIADNGTVAIGEGLQYLPQLRTLDLSQNSIGYLDDETIAIGEGLKYLHQLRTLNLSENHIGSYQNKGTVVIGEGLHYLPHLQSLDLSRNWIGTKGDNGIIAIGQGLQYLPHLQTLNLSHNAIGYTGDQGGIAIGEGLHYLPHLQSLDLSRNWIGTKGDNGTIAIGEGLKYLPQLRTLDFSQNYIVSGFSNFVNSIVSLKTLESLFVQQFYVRPIPSSQLNLLKQFWNHRNPQTDVYALITLEDVQTYLNSLPNNTKTIDLSQNFPDPSADVVTLLFKGITNFHELQTLDLSQNWIGVRGDNGTIAIGEGLHYLPHLQTLDLSQNYIGVRGDQGTVAIGKGLHYLPHLQTLDLSDNLISYREGNGTVAIGQGFKYLSQLQHLDLSQNRIGYTENGTVAIGEGLHYLSQLQTLDFSQNYIGYTENGTVAIGEGLKYLPHLQTLDLSQSYIGVRGGNGTVAIGEGLHYLPQLRTLDLSQNHIGYTENGTVAIGEGLHYLPQLQALDLSQNQIGLRGDNGTVAIGQGLKCLSRLQTLDLSHNYIGGFGAQSLFKDLPQLICHGLQTLDLSNNNFTGIYWSQAANALEGLYSAQIQKACEANRCFGTPIHVNTTALQCKASQSPDNGLIPDICVPVPSSASTLSPPYIFKVASENRELLGSVALLFFIGHQLSPLASKAKEALSSWFEEEQPETKASSNAQSSSWIYFPDSFLFFIWFFLFYSFVNEG